MNVCKLFSDKLWAISLFLQSTSGERNEHQATAYLNTTSWFPHYTGRFMANIRQVRKSPTTGINIPAYLTGAFWTTKAKFPPNQTANPPQKYICRYRKIKITESYINVQTIRRWKIVRLFCMGNRTPMSVTTAQNKVTCLFSVKFSPKSFTVIKPDWQEPI